MGFGAGTICRLSWSIRHFGSSLGRETVKAILQPSSMGLLGLLKKMKKDWDMVAYDFHPTLWLWLTVRHGISMALIEIDGLPNLKMGGSVHGKLLNNQMVSYTLAGLDYQWLSIVTSGEPMFYPRKLARSVAKKRRVFPYRGELWSFHAWFPSGLPLYPSQNEPESPRYGFGRWFFSWKCGSCIFPPQSGGRRVITSSCSSNFDVCPGMISQGFHESNVRFSR